MSGVFLVVSDDEYDKSKVLRTTSGGYPHITLFYSGKYFTEDILSKLGQCAFDDLLDADETSFSLTKDNAKLNSFFHEKQQQQRYDVLLHLSEEGVQKIEEIRGKIKALDVNNADSLSMGPPHVTHSIHWSEAEAKAALEQVQEHLPITVKVVGYTID